jgi:Holliday junction resolvase RusA-like endonuclease
MNQPTLFNVPEIPIVESWPEVVQQLRPCMTITVPDVPIAQPRQRHRKVKAGGKEFIQNYTPASDPVNAFKATVRMAAREVHKGPPLTGALRVKFVFVFPRHSAKFWKSKPMPRYPHVSTPDQDNLCKSVQDALNKLLWADDSQIAQAVVEKWHAAGDEQPHVRITIEAMT